jgi:TRAP-type C4-dicarboxylate transport system substrate-binding protein
MNLIRRIVGGIVAGVFFYTTAQAAEVTLTVHHFMSPKGSAQTVLIGPWAKKIEADSKGRIEIKIFPSMSMGGKPPELYRQVRDGVADIVWTLPGYTPGVFPRSEVFELPTVHKGSAQATNQAIQENFALIADDFRDVHPILIHVHAGNALHTVSKEILTVADVKGLKFRTPSRTGSWMLQAWEAEPVGMPLPALPQALSKGTVDGALVPFEVFPPLKFYQLTKNSYEGEDLSRFGTSVFMFAMNKDRYNSLPVDLKKVIDDNSGATLAATIGESWDKIEAPGKLMQARSKGGSVVKLNKLVKDTFDAKNQVVIERWTSEMTTLGIDGVALVKSARSSVYKFSK